MPNNSTDTTLKRVEELLQHLVAIQLYQSGVSQQSIAKHLRIATAKANELLKGVEKVKVSNENTKPQNR